MIQSNLDIEAANADLESVDAEGVIRWAHQNIGQGLVLTSSFGAQAAVMLHLATRVVPGIPVVLIDTGYLFPETYKFAEKLREQMDLNLKVFGPQLSSARYEALHGRQWEQGDQGLEDYNRARKVEPLQRALKELGATAWLAGLRSQQTDFRAGLKKMVMQNGIYKLHPILDWTSQQVHEYLKQHSLPYHPLFEKGFLSIGDTHTTVAVTDESHERSGRFGGLKQECGIHLPTSVEEDESREASGL